MLGLLVAVIAYCFYQSLNTQLADFDLEMRIATRGLATGLTACLQQLRTDSPIEWPSSLQTPAVPVSPVEGPRLRLIPTSRHGVWQLFWPNTQSDSEASAVLDAASTIALIYGIISCVQQWARHQWFDGLIVLAFFEIARRISAKRSPWGLAAVLVYLLAATLQRFHLYGLSDGTLCLLLAPLPLLGGLKAAVSLKARNASLRQHLLLASLLVYVPIPPSLISTGLVTYVASGDAMLPTITSGDSLLLKTSPHTPLTRGQLLQATVYDVPATVRLVALPGDSVQINAGLLILNGLRVHESYAHLYTAPQGDFPLPAGAYPDELTRLYHHQAFGSAMNRNTVYRVPAGQYFLLNDNRSNLFDSRTIGPIERPAILARPLLVYRLDDWPFHFPRIPH